MFKHVAVATAIAVSLSASAAHSWAPGPSQTGEAFSATSRQCKLVAEIGDSAGGFVVASGHPQFVGGAAARQQNIYTACMEANGFYAPGTSRPTDHLSAL
jgi:hypothetical protein